MERRQSPTWDDVRRASAKSAGYLYTRYVNRWAARFITYPAARLGLTPNVLSVVSLLLTLAAVGAAFAGGEERSWVLATWALLAVGYVFDSADGQLARVSQRTSKAGGFLDHSLDGAKVPLTMAAIGFVYHLHADPALAVGSTAWPGLALIALASWYFSITWQKDALVRDRSAWIKPGLTVGYLARTPFDHGVILLWLPALVLAPSLATVGFQLFVVAYGGFVLALFVKGYQVIAALDDAETRG
jgi:phosphatidylglycerophosphate synthase